MAFWKNKSEKTLIPPISEPRNEYSRAPPSTRSNYSGASTYVASRDGDPYNSAPSSASIDNNYNRNKSVGDKYTRGQGELDRDRNELFSGYNPEKAGSRARFFDGPTPRQEPPPGEEGEEDVEGIKSQTKYVKQESVNSTRNALRLAREAEETARGTLGRLGDQSEKLANTERHLDVSKGHSSRADDKTDELKKLNRSIFRPAITFNKDAKRAAQEAKLQSRYGAEREEREKAMLDIRETQNRLGSAASYGRGDDDDDDGEGIAGGSGAGKARYRTEQQLADRKTERKRYQFEAAASDDELEDELDDNLDDISKTTKALKTLAEAMGGELEQQNGRIERIEKKTIGLDERVFKNTEKLKRIK